MLYLEKLEKYREKYNFRKYNAIHFDLSSFLSLHPVPVLSFRHQSSRSKVDPRRSDVKFPFTDRDDMGENKGILLYNVRL
jgi:hypothetical protein